VAGAQAGNRDAEANGRAGRAERPDVEVAPGEDPQLAGIVPEPQPPREDW